jgi:hypothetical protein
LAISWLAAAAPAHAQQQVQPKALIWVATPVDRALVERVRGQVSDLDLELVVVESDAAASRQMPDAAHVFAVVRFTRDDPSRDRIVVHIRPSQGNLGFDREVGDGTPTPGGELGSATLEAAALIVREALRYLVTAEPPALKPAQKAAPRPAQALPRDRRSHEPAAAGSRIGFSSEALWELVFDGAGFFRRSGPGLRLGAEYSRLELSAWVTSSLPVTEHDQYGAVRLRRHAFGLRGGRHWQLSAPVSLDLGVVMGAALYVRSAQRLEPFVSARSDRTSKSVLFGPELRLGWAPASGPLELGLSFSLLAVPGAPRIGYQVDGRFEPSFVIWRLQPSLALGAKLRTMRSP